MMLEAVQEEEAKDTSMKMKGSSELRLFIRMRSTKPWPLLGLYPNTNMILQFGLKDGVATHRQPNQSVINAMCRFECCALVLAPEMEIKP